MCNYKMLLIIDQEHFSHSFTNDYRILFFIIGPMIIAMTILHRSAGMKGMTQTASAADTVYPDWKQNHTVPNA